MVENVMRRYSQYLLGVSPESISNASLGEYAAVCGPYQHQGVEIYFLDLSSGNPTGTFKDWLACVTIAYCLENGIHEFVTQTSGNTGNALVRYAEPHGIKVHVFYPRDSAWKIQPQVAEHARSRFYELNCTETQLKEHTARFAAEHSIPWLPNFSHQIESNKIRAYFLQDWSRHKKVTFGWHAQALSSAYGVFGFYRGLEEIRRRGESVVFPRLLGAQQGAVSPYFDHLYGMAPDTQQQVIEPTLFRTKPTPELLQELSDICARNCGLVIRVTSQLYAQYLPQALAIYTAVDLNPQLSRITGDFTEKAPLISLIGVLERIESGHICPGEKVLVAATGGFGVVPSHQFLPLSDTQLPVWASSAAQGG